MFKLIWSTEYDEQICENIYNDCENRCSDDYTCPFKTNLNEIDYDYCNDCINEDLNLRFKENEYSYFVIGDSCYWYGGFPNLKPNMNGFSDIYDSIEEILLKLSDSVGMHSFRIYKGKYNTLWIELSHHDGSELYQVCRLNKKGQDYYDNYYNFDFRKYCVKGVFKDFKKNF